MNLARKFEEIGKTLDETIQDTDNLVLREQAGMDAIFSVHKILTNEVFKSFTPTVGIDYSDGRKNRVKKLKSETIEPWTSSYDKKKYVFLNTISNRRVISPFTSKSRSSKEFGYD